MIHLFAKNKKVGSRLIRWGTDGLCSHYAAAFRFGHRPDVGIVFHSHIQGVVIEALPYFLNHSKVVYALGDKDANSERDFKIFADLSDQLYGHEYDFMAVAYFSYRVALKKFFGIPLPVTNKWSTEKPLCTGIAEVYKKYHGDYFKVEWPTDFDMTSPQQLYEIMRGSDKLKSLEI